MKAEVLKAGFQNITQATNSSVMFAVKDKVLYLGAHSETVTLVMTAENIDHEDFRYVLPADHVKQIAKTLKSGEVTIEAGDNEDTVVIKNNKSRATYTTMSLDTISYQLLMMHYKEGEFLYRVSGPELTRAFQTTSAFSVSDVDDIRVKNLHFAIEGDVVEVAASNNFTLAKYTFASEKNYGKGDFPLKLVSKSFAFLTKTFGEYLDIGFGKKLYYKSTDGTFTYKVTLPIVDAEVFPYRALFEALEKDTNSVSILLDKEEFLDKGKAFLYFTDENVRNKVKLIYDSDTFRIEGSNARGAFDTEMTPVKSTAKGDMFVSLDYLTKAANTVQNLEIDLKIVQNRILIKDGNFAVLMPPLRK